jgi:octaprenyl-diphosphate synthase
MSPDLALQTLRHSADLGQAPSLDAHVEALREFLGGELERVESELPEALGESIAPLVETGVHLIRAGGKRIRPILTLLSAGCVGVTGPEVRRLACAGELVHLASLLHDDVVDNADLRRGVDTPRIIWSNAASVLGGDYALTRALEMVGSLPQREPLMEAVTTLRALVEGEVIQLQHRGTGTLTISDYQAIVDRKTASLFRWCCRAGVWLSAASHHAGPLGDFGFSLGACFQIVDDVLDVTAATEESGKEPFTDLFDGKLTLPVLLALESLPHYRAPLVTVFAALRANDSTAHEQAAAFIQSFVPELHRCGALNRARSMAVSAAHNAIDSLHEVPRSAHRDALETIAASLAQRMR